MSGLLRSKHTPREPKNKTLLRENEVIKEALFRAADKYKVEGDLRWLFTRTHGLITKKIIDNIRFFENGERLLLFNQHFGNAYLKAVKSQPSRYWKIAFVNCEVLKWGSEQLYGETELCAVNMAYVHINIDIRNALQEIGCINVNDYSRVMSLIQEAQEEAFKELRGGLFLGLAEKELSNTLGSLAGLDVKAWRNGVYEKICKIPVPEVNFNKRYVPDN